MGGFIKKKSTILILIFACILVWSIIGIFLFKKTSTKNFCLKFPITVTSQSQNVSAELINKPNLCLYLKQMDFNPESLRIKNNWVSARTIELIVVDEFNSDLMIRNRHYSKDTQTPYRASGSEYNHTKEKLKIYLFIDNESYDRSMSDYPPGFEMTLIKRYEKLMLQDLYFRTHWIKNQKLLEKEKEKFFWENYNSEKSFLKIVRI